MVENSVSLKKNPFSPSFPFSSLFQIIQQPPRVAPSRVVLRLLPLLRSR